MTVARGEIRIGTGAADSRARYGTQADAAIVDRVIGRVHLIFYVSDQAAATAFWQAVLACPPALDVPGMTEFALGAHVVLGLMPETGIRSLLGSSLPDPAAAHGIPRAELYLVVDNAAAYHARAQAAGATELSALTRRSWGDDAAYCLDPDGHVVAFATDNRQPVADQANHCGWPPWPGRRTRTVLYSTEPDAAATGRSLRPARQRPARENGKTRNSDPARGGRGHRS